ncbi:MAG: hypothetical protein RSA91_04380 [Bacilli bacterium]
MDKLIGSIKNIQSDKNTGACILKLVNENNIKNINSIGNPI